MPRFLQACSAARQIAHAPAPAEQQRWEDEACALFFRAASLAFEQPAGLGQQAAALAAAAAQLRPQDRAEGLQDGGLQGSLQVSMGDVARCTCQLTSHACGLAFW
jgi:hypothetical protein